MEAHEYDVMARLQYRHWWFAAKRRVVDIVLRRLLGPADGNLEVLEAGCGTGPMLPVLRARGRVVGLDAHLPGLLHARGVARVGGDLLALPFPDRSFDLVAAFDVLYHRRVPDVGAALAELHRVSRPGGHLVLTDSAVPALRGPHDVAQHGARRFRRRELDADLERTGFEVRHSTHFHTLLFPLAASARLLQRWRHGTGSESTGAATAAATTGEEAAARGPGTEGEPRGRHRAEVGRSDMKPVPAWLNSLLSLVYRVEAPLAARLPLPLGLSLLAVARRRP